MEEKVNNKEYRLIQINNYVRTKKDYLKIKRAQKLSRELTKKFQREKLEKLKFNFYDEDDEDMCRICFENETIDNELIRPCKCKGSHKYIHRSCLMTWIHVNRYNPEKRDYCDICNYKFKYSIGETKENEIVNNIAVNINLNPYLIKQNFSKVLIRQVSIILLAMSCSGLDMHTNFFSVRLLSLGLVDNNSQIIKDFSIINENSYSYMRGYMYFVYLSYILSFVQTQFVFFSRIYFNRYKYITYEPYKTFYNNKMSSTSISLTLSNLLFYIFFYVSLLTNQSFTLQFFIVIFVIVSINYDYFILKHNKIINELIFNIHRDNNTHLFRIDGEHQAEILEYNSEIGSNYSEE